MGILNTFYILFKSNAEDVIKGNKAIAKSTKETERDLKNTNDEADKLGKNFVKTMDSVAGALGAIAGFNILKNGINQTATFNSQLKQLSDLTGQNVQTLKAMGQAATAAGGSATGAMADIQALHDMASSRGGKLGSVEDYFRSIRSGMKGMSMEAKQQAMTQVPISDPGLRWMLMSASDNEFERRMSSARAHAPFDQKSADAAFGKTETDANLSGATGTFWTKTYDTIEKVYQKAARKAGEIIMGSSESTAGVIAGNAAVLGGATAGAFGLWKSIKAVMGLGGTAASVAGPAAGPLAVGAGSLAVGGAAGYYGLGLFSKPIENWLIRRMGQDPALADGPLSSSMRTGNADLDFWIRKGYSPAQAAGILANMQHESGGDPSARGDGGAAHGLFQWHPDRRADILKNTGIDISNATREQQMEAAAWEMKHGAGAGPFSDEYFRSLGSAGDAAAYFSQNFERPADGGMQALLRAKTALSMASAFPGNAGGNTVNIENIEINTQSTDANGIAADLRDELSAQLGYLEGNYDDGVDR